MGTCNPKFQFHNSLSMELPDHLKLAALLFDRLLWLRNHYEFGNPELKKRVLADIDAVLDHARSIRDASEG